MARAADITGTAFEGGTITTLARIIDAAGAAIQQADIDTISYTIWQFASVAGAATDAKVAVEEHEDVALDPADVIFDSLQDDELWDVDSSGYNFRHVVDVSTNLAFAAIGTYRIDYHLMPVVGQIIIARFLITVI